MACVGEAIGLSLPNSNMMPAPYPDRASLAVAAGEQVMALVERNLRPRDICTRAAFENAARVVAATGGSRSEEHTSELTSLMRISYAVFCLKNKKTTRHNTNQDSTQPSRKTKKP